MVGVARGACQAQNALRAEKHPTIDALAPRHLPCQSLTVVCSDPGRDTQTAFMRNARRGTLPYSRYLRSDAHQTSFYVGNWITCRITVSIPSWEALMHHSLLFHELPALSFFICCLASAARRYNWWASRRQWCRLNRHMVMVMSASRNSTLGSIRRATGHGFLVGSLVGPVYPPAPSAIFAQAKFGRARRPGKDSARKCR